MKRQTTAQPVAFQDVTRKVTMEANIMDGNVTNVLAQYQNAHRTKCGEEAYDKNHHIIVSCENTACLVALCETCARLRYSCNYSSTGDPIDPSDRTLSSWL